MSNSQLSSFSGINKLSCCSYMTLSTLLQHSACPAFPSTNLSLTLFLCVCLSVCLYAFACQHEQAVLGTHR